MRLCEISGATGCCLCGAAATAGAERRGGMPGQCTPARPLTCRLPLPATLPLSIERWGRDWALLALAAADNTALCLEHYCDALAQ